MSAYLRQDRIGQEYQEIARLDDLMIERMSGEVIEDSGVPAIVLSSMDEEVKTTQRLDEALRQFYVSYLISSVDIQLRAALYGVVKKHCQASLEKCA